MRWSSTATRRRSPSAEEIFGPVVAVAPFDDETEAIELANATQFGLAAYIWTSNLKRGHRIAHGTVKHGFRDDLGP